MNFKLFSKKVTVRKAYENKLLITYKGRKVIDIEFHGYGYGPINCFDPNPPFCYRIIYFDKKGNEKKVMLAEYEKVKLIRK